MSNSVPSSDDVWPLYEIESFRAPVMSVTNLLQSLGVSYHLTGSAAFFAHGEPRMTQDFDFVVHRAELTSALGPFIQGLRQEGFMFNERELPQSLAAGRMFQLLDTVSILKLDLYPRELRYWRSERKLSDKSNQSLLDVGKRSKIGLLAMTNSEARGRVVQKAYAFSVVATAITLLFLAIIGPGSNPLAFIFDSLTALSILLFPIGLMITVVVRRVITAEMLLSLLLSGLWLGSIVKLNWHRLDWLTLVK